MYRARPFPLTHPDKNKEIEYNAKRGVRLLLSAADDETRAWI